MTLNDLFLLLKRYLKWVIDCSAGVRGTGRGSCCSEGCGEG